MTRDEIGEALDQMQTRLEDYIVECHFYESDAQLEMNTLVSILRGLHERISALEDKGKRDE